MLACTFGGSRIFLGGGYTNKKLLQPQVISGEGAGRTPYTPFLDLPLCGIHLTGFQSEARNYKSRIKTV